MSAVITDLNRELAALRDIRQRHLPVRCRTPIGNETIDRLLQLIDDCTHLVYRRIKSLQQEEQIGPPMPDAYEVVREHFDFPFELYPFQVQTVNELGPKDRAGYYLEPGCVDADTEFLTPSGWKRIADYEAGDLVAQWVPPGQAEFVQPLRYIKESCERMYHFKTKYGMDMVLSPEHRMVYLSPTLSGYLREKTAEQVVAIHKRATQGFTGRFMTTFSAPLRSGLPISDTELRLMVAVIADGHFGSKTNHCVIRLKKERKKGRLRVLLAEAGVEYRERECNGKTSQGFTIFCFKAPMRAKSFGPEFFQCNAHQLAIISSEISYWDGSFEHGRMSFSTSVRESADFVQYAMATCGARATIRYRLRERANRPASHEYTVVITSKRNALVGLSGGNTDPNAITEVCPADGYKYCFSVPSSYLILRRNARIFITGNCGKTGVSTHAVLYKAITHDYQTTLVLMPPILINTWARWLRRVKHRSGGSLKVTCYQGGPKQREKIKLEGHFILMSMQIFKKDFERIMDELGHKRVCVIVDEATSVKNCVSDNHKKVEEFAADKPLLLLTGTPLNSPADAYAYCKLVAPGIYRNQHHFENIHVDKRDFFGHVTRWRDLDYLAENMKVNAVRVLKEEVLMDLPPVTYTPLYYDLDPDHYKLYKRVADEQLVKLDDGGKLDLTKAQALYHALQQIVMNYSYFGQDTTLKPAGLDMLDEVLEEIGPDRKIIVFANYRMTNRMLVEHLKGRNAVAVFGEVTRSQQAKNVDKFIDDPKCQILIGQPTSMGYGVDGLQEVCSDVFFAESPITPAHFTQAMSRVYRDGQRRGVNVRIAVAERTLQVRLFNNLMQKDALVNLVQGGWKDLREAIFGG